MGYIGAIINLVGMGVKLLGSSGGPSYPSPPKLFKLPVQKAKKHLEAYEADRMKASIDAWKERFPELYKGGQFMVDDIRKQQQGMLGGSIAEDMERSGLGPVREGDQYQLSRDIGLSPITLSQRTSQAVTRQIAQNPEWTNKITGGTLATMLANNAQNQTAYGMMTNANKTAQYVAGKTAGLYNTQALLGGITGAARIGSNLYDNQFGPLSASGQGAYSQPTQSPYAPPPTPPMDPTQSGPYNNNYWGVPSNPYYAQTPPNPTGWGAPPPSTMYSGAWDQNQIGNLFMPTGGN